MHHLLSNLYTGTSGLVLPVKNKAAYPPQFQEKSRLCFYGSLFNSIEINSCFYKVPQRKTLERWTQETPDDFRFTFKLWRDVTHNKGLFYQRDELFRFIDVIAAAGEKTGCLLVQFPGGVRSEVFPQVSQLLSDVREATARRWDVAVEFRHRSWNTDETFDLLNENGFGLVLHDKGDATPPLQALDADVVYLRFHGPSGNYRGSYDESFLYEYAQYAREWLAEGKRVYAYFNNTMGDAMSNLLMFNDFLRED